MSKQTTLLNNIELWIKKEGIEIDHFILMLEGKHPTVQLVVKDKPVAPTPAPAPIPNSVTAAGGETQAGTTAPAAAAETQE